MKVLHLLDETNRGGAEMLALDVCKNGKSNGLDVVCVSLRGGDLENEFKDSGALFIKLNRHFARDLKTIFHLRSIIKKNNIGIIHSHTIIGVTYAYLATVGLSNKIIFTHHGFNFHEKNMDELLKKILVPKVTLNIAVSNSFLKNIWKQKRYKAKTKFTVVYNGIDTKKIKLGGEPLLNNAKSNIRLGMIGNFINNKNQIIICKALVDVIQKHPDIEFIFVGRKDEEFPEEFDNCYDYCTEYNLIKNVKFLGKRNDVYHILNSLDIFVFSSLNESFGIAVIEAMISGLPVILSDIDTLREISSDGKYALLYRANDPSDLSLKMNRLIEDEFFRMELGKNARDYAMKNFSIEKHIQRLIELYSSINNKKNI